MRADPHECGASRSPVPGDRWRTASQAQETCGFYAKSPRRACQGEKAGARTGSDNSMLCQPVVLNIELVVDLSTYLKAGIDAPLIQRVNGRPRVVGVERPQGTSPPFLNELLELQRGAVLFNPLHEVQEQDVRIALAQPGQPGIRVGGVGHGASPFSRLSRSAASN